VWIHGGGWRKGDKRIGARKKADLFTNHRYLFASINYRLSPAESNPDPERADPGRIRFPDHPTDVGEALGWLRHNVAERGGDPRRFVLMGHSAGAHLAALVATDPEFGRAHGFAARRVRGFVSLDSPAFDIAAAADPAGDRHRASREMLWNAFATPDENERTNAWQLGSPLRFAEPADPPGLLVTQAAIDERVDEAHRMAVALGGPPAGRVLAVGLDHREINHAVGQRPDPSGVTSAVLSFVRRQTRGANAR
jgi:acetyl esterase/lipase